MKYKDTIIQGNALEVLKTAPKNVADCLVTSPPYWQVRDYKVDPVIWDDKGDCDHNFELYEIIKKTDRSFRERLAEESGKDIKSVKRNRKLQLVSGFCHCGAWYGQLGQEPSPDLFVKHLVDIFVAAKRVLKPTATLWINISDSYGSPNPRDTKDPYTVASVNTLKGFKKSLVGVPFRFVLEMFKHGFKLRNTIIWQKPNAMPSCLHPDTRIFVKDSENLVKQIPIAFVKSNDRILTPNGWKRVINKWETEKKPLLLKIGKVDQIICSKDHRFAIKHDRRGKSIHYIEASNIRGKNENGHYNDYFVYKNLSQFLADGVIDQIDITKNNSIDWFADLRNDTTFKCDSSLELARKSGDISLRKYKYKNNWVYASNTHNEVSRRVIRVNRIKDYPFRKVKAFNSTITEPRYYSLSYDLGFVLGLYTADGGFNQPRGYQGKITLHKDQVDIANAFKTHFIRSFGHSVQKEIVKDNYREIKFTSASFYVMAKEIFISGKVNTKRLKIDLFLNSPISFKQGFIEGYFCGDGYRNSNRSTITSTSGILIKQVQLLLAIMGSLYSTGEFESKNEKWNKITTLWSNKSQDYNKQNESYIRKADSKLENNKIKMIDIEVEGGTFLIENGLISHNSIKDRFTVDFEYMFLFAMQEKYYFEQQFEPLENPEGHSINAPNKFEEYGNPTYSGFEYDAKDYPMGRNMRSVWNINTRPTEIKHYASYPPDLIKVPIAAGSPEGGLVLDPFMGIGTTAIVAKQLERHYLGIELNPKYIRLSKERFATKDNLQVMHGKNLKKLFKKKRGTK